MLKMKAPRRASRPTGAPPNNILAPYPPPPPSIPLLPHLTRRQSRYYRLYERRWSAGGTFIFITRTREDTTGQKGEGGRLGVEIATAGGSEKDSERKKEKEKEGR